MSTNGRGTKCYPGARYGKLVIIECLGKAHNYKYKCKCDCGKEVIKSWTSLRNVAEPSCGCGRKQGHVINRNDPKPKSDDHHIVASFKRDAKHPVTISDAEILRLMQSPCKYCGAKPGTRVVRAKGNKGVSRTALANGIDRVDSSKGYEPGNCVPCCKPCNSMKGAQQVESFLDRIRRIAANIG